MAARTGMAWIVSWVRRDLQDVDSEWFQDDDDIQQMLDLYRSRLNRVPLTYDVEQKVYNSEYKILEGDPDSWGSGIAIYKSADSGATAVTPDSFNLAAAEFTFTTDQDSDLYLDGWSYKNSFHRACARLLRQLAADQNRVTYTGRGGQVYAPYRLDSLAAMHEKMVGPTAARIVRLR